MTNQDRRTLRPPDPVRGEDMKINARAHFQANRPNQTNRPPRRPY